MDLSYYTKPLSLLFDRENERYIQFYCVSKSLSGGPAEVNDAGEIIKKIKFLDNLLIEKRYGNGFPKTKENSIWARDLNNGENLIFKLSEFDILEVNRIPASQVLSEKNFLHIESLDLSGVPGSIINAVKALELDNLFYVGNLVRK